MATTSAPSPDGGADGHVLVGAVLCAGFGTRLHPLTDFFPKPLIPFLNTPLVAYALDHLYNAGARAVGINLHHLADAVPPVVDPIAAQMDLDVRYAREWDILGTAGGIRGIWEAVGTPDDATMVVLNGDSVMNLDLARHLEAHHRSGADVTLVARPKASGQPGRVWIDDQERLARIRDFRRPDAPEQLTEVEFSGVHILSSRLLEQIPLEPGDIIANVYGPMLTSGQPVAISLERGFWAALDNPGLFLETQRRVLEDPSSFAQIPLPAPLAEGLYVFHPQGIDDKAQLAGPILTGLHVSIGANAHIGPNVTLDGVEVAPNATIRNAALFGMGRVEGEWIDCIAVAGKVAQL